MTNLKLIDELLVDLKHGKKTWHELEFGVTSTVATRQAMQRLRDAWACGEMPEITLSLAEYFGHSSGGLRHRPSCKYPGCIATANDGRDHCTIHYPENVAHRAVVVVTTHLHALVSRKQPFVSDEKTPGFQKRMTTIREDIVYAIKRTT